MVVCQCDLCLYLSIAHVQVNQHTLILNIINQFLNLDRKTTTDMLSNKTN